MTSRTSTLLLLTLALVGLAPTAAAYDPFYEPEEDRLCARAAPVCVWTDPCREGLCPYVGDGYVCLDSEHQWTCYGIEPGGCLYLSHPRGSPICTVPIVLDLVLTCAPQADPVGCARSRAGL
ncbi:MAG TPA: hypothetical protein VM582_05785 [Candidatus Thermoplasmatota archaeon]|nr:hypothetical protein [Candidatus Thermoplasmatota archaeon]